MLGLECNRIDGLLAHEAAAIFGRFQEGLDPLAEGSVVPAGSAQVISTRRRVR
jgi:hypothetical protein